eukprot:scaffold103185_cov63-Phaeocystis_antarctica.AAC.1
MATVAVVALKPEAATLALRAAERVEAGTLAKASDAETMAVASGAACSSEMSAVTCTLAATTRIWTSQIGLMHSTEPRTHASISPRHASS